MLNDMITMKFINHLLVIVGMFYSLIAYAHDADKAYFKILEEDDNTVVFAEFPWSIRKVLDNVKNKTNNESLQDKLVNYLKDNLILENKKGEVMPFFKIELVKNKNEDHHSMVNYKVYFIGNNLHRVTNTVMCDFFKKQLNFNSLPNETVVHVTSSKEPSFVVKLVNPYYDNVTYYVISFLGLVGTVILLVFYKKDEFRLVKSK